ncbi:hypothetical protein NDU88_001455 [Pleurodeles waltl]|uniref:Uncharacterized protein n=1 Tax=Pleurodeles waltl TaxID=8319 RepID=A0AAV7UAC7_PLEWA|nr:hypothetical protein NDU88_001455 [Pleurodeles waltl]
MHTTGEAIADAFATYYEQLYKSPSTHTEEECVDLLKDISIQVLSGDDRAYLEQDLTEEEVGNEIRELKGRLPQRIAHRIM